MFPYFCYFIKKGKLNEILKIIIYFRLKTEIERITLEGEEREQQMVLRHNHELASLREQLSETESARNLLQNEVKQ